MDNVGRIHRRVFEFTVGILFGLSIIAATVRTTIRARQQGRLLFDDYLLLFGCANHIAATILIYITLDTMYWNMVLLLNPGSPSTIQAAMAPDFADRIKWFRQVTFAYTTLTWSAIFAIKVSFLLFFRKMADRLKSVIIYWKVVVGITVISYCYCVACPYISCPHSIDSSQQCGRGRGFARNLGAAASGMALDIVTDLLIVSIPIIILWRVKIRPRQKVGVGAFLCLNIFMAAAAIARIPGLKGARGTVDPQWQLYWHQVEAGIGVLMISITAFRSLFGIKAQVRERKHRAWYLHRDRFLSRRRKRGSDGLGSNDYAMNLPTIPGATMTGLRSFIHGETGLRTAIGRDDYGHRSSTNDTEGIAKDITVARVISSASEKTSTDSHRHTSPGSQVINHSIV